MTTSCNEFFFQEWGKQTRVITIMLGIQNILSRNELTIFSIKLSQRRAEENQ